MDLRTVEHFEAFAKKGHEEYIDFAKQAEQREELV